MIFSADFWMGLWIGSMTTSAVVVAFLYRAWRTEQQLSAILAEELPEDESQIG